jgi:hypothetical protein
MKMKYLKFVLFYEKRENEIFKQRDQHAIEIAKNQMSTVCITYKILSL